MIYTCIRLLWSMYIRGKTLSLLPAIKCLLGATGDYSNIWLCSVQCQLCASHGTFDRQWGNIIGSPGLLEKLIAYLHNILLRYQRWQWYHACTSTSVIFIFGFICNILRDRLTNTFSKNQSVIDMKNSSLPHKLWNVTNRRYTVPIIRGLSM